jgi:hypothetical protein
MDDTRRDDDRPHEFEAPRGRGGEYHGQPYGENLTPDPAREDRSWWDRARDEVGSWFGDEAAGRRRRTDAEREHDDARRDDTGWSDRIHADDHTRRDEGPR